MLPLSVPFPFSFQYPPDGTGMLVLHECAVLLIFALTFLDANRSQERIRIWVACLFHATAVEAMWLWLGATWHATAAVWSMATPISPATRC